VIVTILVVTVMYSSSGGSRNSGRIVPPVKVK
jgi:hypothetical protein